MNTNNVNQDELGKVIRAMQSQPKIDPAVNQAELGKVIRDMQGAQRPAPTFNQAAADIVSKGANDKRKL